MPKLPTGYSGTPLAKKLGLKPGFRALIIGAPDAVVSMATAQGLASLSVVTSATAARRQRSELDYIHLFALSAADLETAVDKLKQRLKSDGMIWLSWPKKASKVPTDLDDTVVRKCGLDAGLVDVKVCAVDDTWSGLKFVYRLKDRGSELAAKRASGRT